MAFARTVLVTGADSGIGRATTQALAAQGSRILMACRDRARAELARAEILVSIPGAELELWPIDLASLASVRALAAELTARAMRIDVLINNAGVYCVKREETADGFERTLGTNYLGPFLLTELLVPCLERAPEPRVINLASNAHRRDTLDLDDLYFRRRKYDAFKAYAASKAAVVMGTLRHAERLRARNIRVNAVHPGHVSTNIWPSQGLGWKLVRPIIDLFLIDAEQGAAPSVMLATSPALSDVSGAYFDRLEQSALDARVSDPARCARLWDETRRALKLG